jgi:S-adenosylmethionine hydrolase
MAARLITLTTDFGLTDHYVGAMKGVILSICPRARIVDISHGVTAYEIGEAAFTVMQTYRFYPRGTVHVVVVDPGVGTSRRPILAEAAGQSFIAPDNGVLSMVLAREKHEVRAITNERYFLSAVSNTFHGRDIFAPVAAHLAGGVAASRFGKRIADCVLLNFDKPERAGSRRWIGVILKVDRFGNLVTNFSAEDFPALEQGGFEMAVGRRRIGAMARNYAEHGAGKPFVILGSAGYYEISVGQGPAAQVLGCGVGSPVKLTLL